MFLHGGNVTENEAHHNLVLVPRLTGSGNIPPLPWCIACSAEGIFCFHLLLFGYWIFFSDVKKIRNSRLRENLMLIFRADKSYIFPKCCPCARNEDVWGNSETAPFIPNLFSRWDRLVGLTLRYFTPGNSLPSQEALWLMELVNWLLTYLLLSPISFYLTSLGVEGYYFTWSHTVTQPQTVGLL